jgi:hypothetical protein
LLTVPSVVEAIERVKAPVCDTGAIEFVSAIAEKASTLQYRKPVDPTGGSPLWTLEPSQIDKDTESQSTKTLTFWHTELAGMIDCLLQSLPNRLYKRRFPLSIALLNRHYLLTFYYVQHTNILNQIDKLLAIDLSTCLLRPIDGDILHTDTEPIKATAFRDVCFPQTE